MRLQAIVKVSSGWYGSHDVEEVYIGPEEKDLDVLYQVFTGEAIASCGPQPPVPGFDVLVHKGRIHRIENQLEREDMSKWERAKQRATDGERWVEWLMRHHGFVEIDKIREL